MDKQQTQQPVAWVVLRGLVDDIQGLIAESDGVAGLHRNGDVAPWGELEAGGQFERLSHLPAAIEAAQCSEVGRKCAELPAQCSEPVNQQLLAALKACDEAMSYMSEYDIPITLPDMVRSAIAAAEAAQPVVCEVCGGTGIDVSFGDADDSDTVEFPCHTCAQKPASAQPVADTELVLFAENQKRKDVEKQRDQLLELLCELVDIEGPQPGTAAWADKTRATIAAVKGGAA